MATDRLPVPRSLPVTPAFLAWAGRNLPGQLTATQLATVAIARAGYDIDLALLRRLASGLSDRKAELEELVQHGILQSRKARDDGPYRITAQLKEAPGIPAREPCRSSRRPLIEGSGAARGSSQRKQRGTAAGTRRQPHQGKPGSSKTSPSEGSWYRQSREPAATAGTA